MGRLTMKSPQDVANKWANNLAQSTRAITTGVQAVTVAPTQLAARQQDAYLMGVQNAVSSGKWQAGLNRVTLGDWQNAMVNVGIPRIATGATAAKPKMEGFYGELLPYVQGQQRALQATPRGSLEQNLNRMVAFARGMSQFKRTR